MLQKDKHIKEESIFTSSLLNEILCFVSLDVKQIKAEFPQPIPSDIPSDIASNLTNPLALALLLKSYCLRCKGYILQVPLKGTVPFSKITSLFCQLFLTLSLQPGYNDCFEILRRNVALELLS